MKNRATKIFRLIEIESLNDVLLSWLGDASLVHRMKKALGACCFVFRV